VGELWLVNTRCLARRCGLTPADFVPEVRRFDPGSGWVESDIVELASGPSADLPIVLAVHGNAASLGEAVEQGRQLFDILCHQCGLSGPARFVVWSWASDRIDANVIRDLNVKAMRTDREGFYLACFLDILPVDVPVLAVGYSYGSRVITAALHVLGGGELCASALEGSPEDAPRRPIHAVLVAAALDDDWLLRGGHHGLAVSQVRRMVIMINPRDRVLCWYPLLPSGSGDKALGTRGLPAPLRPSQRPGQVVEVNVRPAVGSRHGWESYIESPAVIARLRREARLAFADEP
jgi:hypothetical protein